MKHLIILTVTLAWSICMAQERSPYLGGICNADADEVKYNFAGVWEQDNQGLFFCNYEKFLTPEEIEAAQYKNDMYSETDADAEEYDEQEYEDEFSDGLSEEE